MFDRVTLIKYYDYLNLTETKILEYIKIALASKKYEDMQKFLYSVSENFETFKSNLQYEWRKTTFKKLFENFNQFIKHNATIKYANDKVKPQTLGKQLEIFLTKSDGNAVEDFKSEYEVPDKRLILARIKTLIDAKKYDDLLIFVEKRQKDFKIPVELVADLLMERGETTWAMKMIGRMPVKKKDEQYILLKRIGKFK